ncbi:MAG: M20 family metallopeptidase [Myxococcota bacterium]
MELRAEVRNLREYVAIPSVNPMGRDDLPAEICGEGRYAEHLELQLRRLGLDVEILGPAERPSVIAWAGSARDRDTLLVASHLDTVPVDGMEIDPFDPRIVGDRLYGRGSCDTKAGMAALVSALEAVLASGTLRRNLIVVGESDEELGSIGARAVIDRLRALPRRPDWSLATEPTELQLVHRHKGVVHARLCARGVAGHSSDPASGRNAIVQLAHAVLSLEQLASDLLERRDPSLGPATLSIGTIGGGTAPNVIPDRAELVLDRRVLPREEADQVRAEIETRLARDGVDEVRVTACELRKAPLSTRADHPAIRQCSSALVSAGREPVLATAAFGTDAGVFEAAGIPGVVLGPGSIA